MFAKQVAELSNTRKRRRARSEPEDRGSIRHRNRLRQAEAGWPGESEQDKPDKEQGEDMMLAGLGNGGEVQV